MKVLCIQYPTAQASISHRRGLQTFLQHGEPYAIFSYLELVLRVFLFPWIVRTGPSVLYHAVYRPGRNRLYWWKLTFVLFVLGSLLFSVGVAVGACRFAGSQASPQRRFCQPKRRRTTYIVLVLFARQTFMVAQALRRTPSNWAHGFNKKKSLS